jgi:predicted metal-dependent hydrolase
MDKSVLTRIRARLEVLATFVLMDGKIKPWHPKSSEYIMLADTLVALEHLTTTNQSLIVDIQTLKDENESLRGQVPKWLTVEEVSRKPISEYYVLRYNDSGRSHVLAVKADFVALHNAAPVSPQPLHAEEVRP